MTGLLVSVRNAEEAAVAMEGGADVVDIKEPADGSLGRATAEIWNQVFPVVGGRLPVSVALGELQEIATDMRSDLSLDSHASEICYAKIGLARCRSSATWQDKWSRFVEMLPEVINPVAVAYVDWERSNAPHPLEVIEVGVSLGCVAVLFDTFEKGHGNLFDVADPIKVREWMRVAREKSIKVVLAGSLDFGSVHDALAELPDLIAVRGCVCSAGRTSPIDPALVQRLSDIVRSHSGTNQGNVVLR